MDMDFCVVLLLLTEVMLDEIKRM